MTLSIGLIAAGSAALAWLSRRALRHPASHGFRRFFAFEAILLLVVLNAPHWFHEPFALRQLASWLTLGVSIVLIAASVPLLHRAGSGARSADRDAANFEWENTGRLVTTGVYRYLRHPMYASLLFLAAGALLKSISPTTIALAAFAGAALAATARAEESENLARFGAPYRQYMATTRRFVPFLF